MKALPWNGDFATFRLNDITCKTLDLLPTERVRRIQKQRNDFRIGIEDIFQHDAKRAWDILLHETAEGRLLRPESVQERTRDQLTQAFGQIDLFKSNELYYPLRVRVHHKLPISADTSDGRGTTYGYVLDGNAEIFQSNQKAPHTIASGGYFALNGHVDISGLDASVIMIKREQCVTSDKIGKATDVKWMKYIDDCDDAILVAPEHAGSPCTNLLIVHPNTHQTAHVHPSDRVGVILSGSATCSTFENIRPESSSSGWREHSMQKGDLFLLPAGKLHKFTTGKDPLTVFTFHPDSYDDENPMLRGTIRNADDLEKLHQKPQ